MSMTQTAIGGAMVFSAMQLAAWAFLPAAPPFTMNTLSVDARAQVITQDRTISTDQAAITLIWTATVEDAHGDSIRRCEGSGVNGYPPGRKSVKFSLQEWTGRESCTFESLPPGVYRLRGSWRGGEISIGALSEPFQVGDMG